MQGVVSQNPHLEPGLVGLCFKRFRGGKGGKGVHPGFWEPLGAGVIRPV